MRIGSFRKRNLLLASFIFGITLQPTISQGACDFQAQKEYQQSVAQLEESKEDNSTEEHQAKLHALKIQFYANLQMCEELSPMETGFEEEDIALQSEADFEF